MATEILAVGANAAESAPQTLDDGEKAIVMLKPAVGKSLIKNTWVLVELQTSDSEWVPAGRLIVSENDSGSVRVIPGPCTFRVSRTERHEDAAIGVDIA